MDRGPPITSTSHRSSQGVFSHRCLRKASAANTVITGLEGSTGIAAQQSLCSCYNRVDVYGIGERGVRPIRLRITVRVIARRGVTRSRPVCLSHLLAKSVDSPVHAYKASDP